MRAATDLLAFLREALGRLFSRPVLVPALLLVALLTATNIVVARNAPQPGAGTFPPLFIVAAAVRIAGLLVLTVGIARILAGSPRPRWRPDGGFWLFVLGTILVFVLSALIQLAIGGGSRVGAATLFSGALLTLIASPFYPWLVALAAEAPLAWRPGPWLRDMRAWLPHLVFWSLLLVSPLGFAHAAIDDAVIRGVGDWFWPAMLFDGPLSAVVLLIGLALNNAAYRRVARR